MIARGILAIVEKDFTQFADFRQRLAQQMKVRQAGGFKCLKQHHLIFPRTGNGGIHFRQIRRQWFLANHMNFMAKEKLCLGKVQGIRAGNIHRVNGIAFRHRFQRGKQMLDRKIIGEVLSLLKAAGIYGG
ncbi:hypothetical protein BvCmsHHP019_00908 [Escherichia coli]|nr:hypothetical protein BvCmsHHP019_00908 [Escherichia coli]